MQSLKNLYRYGMGPSSSHTMGPRRAAEKFKTRCAGKCDRVVVELYGSLSLTGKGHFTDRAVIAGLDPLPCEIVWMDTVLEFHPNGMVFRAIKNDKDVDTWTVFSIGGGELREEGHVAEAQEVYSHKDLGAVLSWASESGKPVWMLARETEGEELWDHLRLVWNKMREAIRLGLSTEGALPGGLNLARRAHGMHARARRLSEVDGRTGMISSYALAVSEQNGAGGFVVTAPTCGSCGVVPAVLNYLHEQMGYDEDSILTGLATGGVVGNVVKQNGSISGAEVGCQGEVGVACAMAAAAAAQILGGSPHHIEYAAEMALEHHLGLTCDPVMGLVQIPCIERNAFAAMTALSCAEYSLLSDGSHIVSFDEAVEVMKKTGHDLPSLYRETAQGGLASVVGCRKIFRGC